MINNLLEQNSLAWIQAILSVKYGGLGIRSTVCVAPSAYLASISSSTTLVEEILPSFLKSTPTLFLDEPLVHWSTGHDCLPRVCCCPQTKVWDILRMTSIAQHLLDDAENDEECAHLLDVSTRKLGAWLRDFPLLASIWMTIQ